MKENYRDAPDGWVERLTRRVAETVLDIGDSLSTDGWLARSVQEWNLVRQERLYARLDWADAEGAKQLEREQSYEPNEFFMGYNPREDKFRTIDPDTGLHLIFTRDQVDSAWGRAEPSKAGPSPDQYSFDKLWFGNELTDEGPDIGDKDAYLQSLRDQARDLTEHGIGYDPDWGENRFFVEPELDNVLTRDALKSLEERWRAVPGVGEPDFAVDKDIDR